MRYLKIIMVLQLVDCTSDMFEDELCEFSSDYYIPYALHPEVPEAVASIAGLVASWDLVQ